MPAPRLRALLPTGLLLSACEGVQSALSPAGVAAERVAELFWWSVGGAAVVWAAVIALGAWALLARRGRHGRERAVLVILGGAVVPTFVLGAYLAYGLSMIPALVAPAPPGSLRIAVSGERWWWRVRYLPEDGEPIPLANELRLPVGRSVELVLDNPDVIHSFWIPALAGKMDMIPGRTTRLALEPTRTGAYRGACAEYCGTSHALMSFWVVVHEEEDFARWLAHQATPARPPATPLARRGREVFLGSGCGACHTVRGTRADGVIGPDLTHLASRLTIGAGILENEAGELLRWIAATHEVKPDVNMPAFGMLPDEDLAALVAYLEGLE